MASKGLSSRDVKNITLPEVAQIYYQNYWVPTGCNDMSKIFAVYSFDTAVNMGVGTVKATGMTRVQEFMKAAQYKDPNKFLLAREVKYRVFANTPDKDKNGNIIKDKNGNPIYSQRKFLKGWLNRVNALSEFAKTI